MKHILPLYVLLLAVGLFLTSCCSTEKFEQRLNTYINRSKVDVVQVFGTPIHTEKFGGNIELVTFLRDRTYYQEGTAPSVHQYREKKKDGTYEEHSYVSAGTSGHYEYRKCEITFRFKNGKAVSWSYQGNDCCDD